MALDNIIQQLQEELKTIDLDLGELLLERAGVSGRLVRTDDAQRRIQAILAKS